MRCMKIYPILSLSNRVSDILEMEAACGIFSLHSKFKWNLR